MTGGLVRAFAGLASVDVPPGALVATVTALRVDGALNVLDMWGGHRIGVPALDVYQGRAVGDTVLIADVGGAPYVIGRVGPDPLWTSPAHAPAETMTFTTTGAPVTGVGRMQQGTDSPDGQDPRQVGWFYGTTLTTAAASATTVWVWMARDPILHGAFGPQTVRLFLHAHTVSPASGFTELAAYAPVLVPLEVGEIRRVALPGAWRSALAAGTARGIGAGNASGLRVSFIRLTEPSGGYTTT